MFRRQQSPGFFTGPIPVATHVERSALNGDFRDVKRFMALRRVLSISQHVSLVHQAPYLSGNVVVSGSDSSLLPSVDAGSFVQLELSPNISFDATDDTTTDHRRNGGTEKTDIIEPVTPRLYAHGVDPTQQDYRVIVFDGLDDALTNLATPDSPTS